MSNPIPPDVLEAIRAALGAQYDITRVLGSGAMGSVLLAHDRTLDRPVAIKIINPELAATSTFRQRFLQEARTVAKLRHGSIVGIHAAGEAGGVLYFVMEFVEGESLRDLLQRQGALPTERAAAITRELASALGYAHRAGVIHRDIKPENILIDRATGHARITDFGIARSLAAAGERMTGTGMSVGTPAYMSPEQASGERDIDGRSDLYSLGLVAYEMLAGTPTFTGESSASVIMKQIIETPAPLVERAAGVPPALAAVIEQALAKDPAERWADGESMARAIDSAVGGVEVAGLRATRAAATHAPNGWRQTGAARGASQPTRLASRTGPRMGIVAVIALAVIAPLIWFATRGGSGAPRGVDPRKSFLVVPFRVQGGGESIAWLRDGSVSMLSLNLGQWEDISVVEHARSLDLLRDAKLDGGADISLEQAQSLARRAGVWTLVMGEVTKLGDSLRVTANLFDVASGERIRSQSAEAKALATADPRPLFDEVANELLGLVGAVGANFEDLAHTTTRSVDAYRHYLAGVRALNEWRLRDADSALGQAVAADSTFALAWYKRSLASGWARAGDTNTTRFARQAMLFAARLPTRERALVEGNFEQQKQNYVAAQQRYRDLLRTDSTDAEVWYALADAHYHDMTPGERGRNLTASLAGFKRTLALDSTFHLAYSHNIDVYSTASRDGSEMIVDGDTVRILTLAEVQRLGPARITEARRRARVLAISNAERWVHTDEDAATAYFALAEAHAAARDYVSAQQTLERAMARPSTRQADFPYRIASYQLGAGSAEALTTLRRALTEQTADSLRLHASARRFNILLAAANVAMAAGALEDFDRVLARLADVDPILPGSERGPRPLRTTFMLGPLRASMFAKLGLDTKGAASEIAGTIKEIDAIPGAGGDQIRRQAVQAAYAGFLTTRDTSYLAVITRWSGQKPSRAFTALAAIEAGDTATATQLAKEFRRNDSTGVVVTQDPSGSFVEAEVLTRLGDLQGALAALEQVDPKNFNVMDIDARWGLYTRVLLDRGELHERLGDAQRADSLYNRVIDVWKDADAKGQPLVDVARRRIADLRDAPARVPIKR